MVAAGVGTASPPRAAPPKLSPPKFVEGVDDMGAFLEVFEATADAAGWAHNHWPIYLRNTLSGQGLLAISSLSAIERNDYITVKATLLATYHVSEESYRKKVFDVIFSAGARAWFRDR